MTLGLLTAAFPDRSAEEIAVWAGGAGFDALEVHCPPGTDLDIDVALEISALAWDAMFEAIPSAALGLNLDLSHLVWLQIASSTAARSSRSA